jgi:hypothetical protein
VAVLDLVSAPVRIVNPLLAALTGTAVAYIIIGLIVLRLIASRVISASWVPLFDGFASVVLGTMSFRFLNPAGVPVIGLAFAAAGLVRESRESKRMFVFFLLAAGAALCGYATFVSLSHAGHD